MAEKKENRINVLIKLIKKIKYINCTNSDVYDRILR